MIRHDVAMILLGVWYGAAIWIPITRWCEQRDARWRKAAEGK